MNISLHGNHISFSFDAPTRETSYLSETFDLSKKRAYATSGIQELLHFRNDLVLQIIL